MNRLSVPLSVLLIPLLAGCNAFDSQCDQYSELDEQVTCLDSAFFDLHSRAEEDGRQRQGEGDGGEMGLRELVAYCEGLREREEDLGEDEGLRERLAWCEELWERIDREVGEDEEERPEGEKGQDTQTSAEFAEDVRPKGEDQEASSDEGDREDLTETLAACEELKEQITKEDWESPDSSELRAQLRVCKELWDRLGGCKDGMWGDLAGLHRATREAVEKSEDPGERKSFIRKGLKAGRQLVDKTGRSKDGEDKDRRGQEGERPR